MLKIYENTLLLSIDKLFRNNLINWILQEDNNLKHKSKLAKKQKEENNIKVLP